MKPDVPPDDRTLVRAGTILAALGVAAVVAGTGLEVASSAGLGDMFDEWFLHNVGAALPLTVAFGVLVRRRPRHPITWMLAVAGVGSAVGSVLPIGAFAFLQARGLGGGPAGASVAPMLRWLNWVSAWSWVPTVLVLPTLLLSHFPDGRPVAPRWRWIDAISVVGVTTVTVGFLVGTLPPFAPASISLLTGGDDLFVPAADVIVGLGFPIVLLGVFGSVASVVVRYRRAGADERRQVRWIALGPAVLGVGTVGFLGGGNGAGFFQVVSLMAIPLIAAAFPVAILKYRLYEIDVVLTRAVTLGVVAAFVAGLYAVVVVGVGSLLGVGDDLQLSVAATIVVALAFEPVRVRVHTWARHRVYGERATPYETIARLAAGSDHGDEDDVAGLAAALAAGVGATSVIVWLRVGDQLVATGIHDAGGAVPAPLPLPVAATESLPGALTEVVRVDGVVVAAITADKPRSEPVTESDRALLADVARAAAPLVQHVRLTAELRARAEQLRESRQRLVALQDTARRRLERDLHDGAQQELVALKVKLGLARTLAQRDGLDELAVTVAGLADTTQEAVEAMRVVARGIYPPLLETEGLAVALTAALRHLDIAVDVAVTVPRRLGRDLESSMYFMCLRLLGTVGAKERATVELVDDTDRVRLVIEATGPVPDDDVIVATEDRAGAADGRAAVEATSSGWRVDVTLPTATETIPSVGPPRRSTQDVEVPA